MTAADRYAETNRWLRYAEEDLTTAESLLAILHTTPRHACWLAQQSVEKALKAVLISLGIDFPRTHDLDVLRNLVPDDWQLKNTHPDLANLTAWATEARYPSDWVEPYGRGSRKRGGTSSGCLDFRNYRIGGTRLFCNDSPLTSQIN